MYSWKITILFVKCYRKFQQLGNSYSNRNIKIPIDNYTKGKKNNFKKIPTQNKLSVQIK